MTFRQSVMKYRRLLIVLLTLIVFLGVVVFALYYLALASYRQSSELYLDPLGLSARAFPEVTASPGDTVVVFYGDSRIASWPPPEALSSYTFINRGINGQTSAQVNLRFPYHVTPLQPDILLIQVGINDLKTIPLFPERKSAIIESTKANIRQLVESAKSTGAAVILTTIFPVGDVPLYRLPFWSSDVALAVADVNAMIRSLSDDQVFLFDAFTLLAEGGGRLRGDYADDELHINAAGYDVLNEELIPILQNGTSDVP